MWETVINVENLDLAADIFEQMMKAAIKNAKRILKRPSYRNSRLKPFLDTLSTYVVSITMTISKFPHVHPSPSGSCLRLLIDEQRKWHSTEPDHQLELSCFRLLNKEVDAEKQIKPKKHKLIAQAYSKRKELEEKSWKLSISFHSSHQDPVGLGFELNSGASGSVRSSWAAALPKFVTRRGALVAGTNSTSSVRRNSVDSQISYSVRRVSVESRRHSVESAVSVKVSEVTQTLVKKVSTPLHKHRGHHKSRTRKISRTKGKKGPGKAARNSASASSNDSNIAMQLMLALAEADKNPSTLKALGYNGMSQKPFLGRRKANAGLESYFALPAGKLFSNRVPSISSSSTNSSLAAKRTHDIELDILKDIEQVGEYSSKEEQVALMLTEKA